MKMSNLGWGCSSVVEHLLSIHKALGLISSTAGITIETDSQS
jgi:hypothetical protein